MTSVEKVTINVEDTEFDKSIKLTQMKRQDGSLYFYPREDITIADYDLIASYQQQTSVIDSVETKHPKTALARDAGVFARLLKRLEPQQVNTTHQYRAGSEIYTLDNKRFIVEQTPIQIAEVIQAQKDHVKHQKLKLELAINFNKAIALHKVSIDGNRKPIETTIENYDGIETIDTVKEDVLFPGESRAKLTAVSRVTFASGNHYIVTENAQEIQAAIAERKQAILDHVKEFCL
tara:strand:+ start:138932 stop:139633 length:702 start_codon:yes stop_codon:yes gene_type:complete